MDPSPLSPSWQFAPTVARGRSPGRNKGKGGEQQRDPTTAEPEFYRISDPLGTDNFLGSRDQELEADYREAILLESLNGTPLRPRGASERRPRGAPEWGRGLSLSPDGLGGVKERESCRQRNQL